jgi:predicted membrane protein
MTKRYMIMSNYPSGGSTSLDERIRSRFGRHGAPPQLIVGTLILTAGILLAVDRLSLLSVGGLARLWPAAIIAIGVGMLVRRSDPQRRFWGAVWLLLGTWLLLRTLGVVKVGLGQLFFPALLVVIGVKLAAGAMRRETASDGSASVSAVMAESKRTLTDAPFRSARMSAFMGGCLLDLRQATIAAGAEAVIDVFSVMGGLDIWVPPRCTVVSQVVSIMASVDDKRLPLVPPQAGPEDAGRLILRGHIVMSGLTIRS